MPAIRDLIPRLAGLEIPVLCLARKVDDDVHRRPFTTAGASDAPYANIAYRHTTNQASDTTSVAEGGRFAETCFAPSLRVSNVQ
jgi:hypothetical protein